MNAPVQRLIKELFKTAPGLRFTVAEIAAAIYGTAEPTRDQLKATRRAADNVAAAYGRERVTIDGQTIYFVARGKALKTALAAKYAGVEIRNRCAFETRKELTGDVHKLDYEVRFAVDADGTFTGHAAVFGERNSHNEIIQRGAFTRTLAAHKSRGSRPFMLWQHDMREIIGVWTDIREDATGLAVTGKIIPETARGQEALALVKHDAINGLSIGFGNVPRGSQRAANGHISVTDMNLVEISLVSIPSSPSARIKSVRSASDLSAFTRAVSRTIETLRKD